MTSKINAVMIDTSAYHECQCDFKGISSSIIPNLHKLMQENNIQLLTHPILEKEIRKHISNSQLVSQVKYLKESLEKYKKLLDMIEVSVDELFEKLNKLDMEKKLNDCFDSIYKDATPVPYVDAATIFSDYFNECPPFNDNKRKRSEFPDAFILKGLEAYCATNPFSNILVVSNDSDWKMSLENNKHIILQNSIPEAMKFLWKQLDVKSEPYEKLVEKAKAEIYATITTTVIDEAFSIDGIVWPEEVYVESANIVNMDKEIIPLEIEDDSALLQIMVEVSFDGFAEYFPENSAVWDNEDKCYYFREKKHLDFKNALAELYWEIRLDFSDDQDFSAIKLDSVNLLNEWEISLSLEEAEISEKDI